MPEPDKTPEEWADIVCTRIAVNPKLEHKRRIRHIKAILAQGKRAGRKEGTRAMKTACCKQRCPMCADGYPASRQPRPEHPWVHEGRLTGLPAGIPCCAADFQDIDSDAVAEGIG